MNNLVELRYNITSFNKQLILKSYNHNNYNEPNLTMTESR